ncbi:MAG: hypothetical protein IPJ09_00940 [Saprospiraceae bacterium]|nr:hypothetical protein [Saprospiraceae bacterium]
MKYLTIIIFVLFSSCSNIDFINPDSILEQSDFEVDKFVILLKTLKYEMLQHVEKNNGNITNYISENENSNLFIAINHEILLLKLDSRALQKSEQLQFKLLGSLPTTINEKTNSVTPQECYDNYASKQSELDRNYAIATTGFILNAIFGNPITAAIGIIATTGTYTSSTYSNTQNYERCIQLSLQ